MFCINCGANLPDGASFCPKCGKPQTQDIQAEEPKWETCEINYKVTLNGLTGTRGYFCADAIGPSGMYVAERGEEFGCGYNTWLPDSNHASRHKALVAVLIGDDWEPTGERGEHWWQNRFRRRVAAGKENERNLVNLVLLTPGNDRARAIKAIMSLTHLRLGDAKKIAETPNATILSGVSKGRALYAQSVLEKAGAVAKIA